MKKITTILLLIFLIGCSSVPKKVSYNCPVIDLPDAPDLPIYSLDNSSRPDVVMKSYVASVMILKHWQDAVIDQVNKSS